MIAVGEQVPPELEELLELELLLVELLLEDELDEDELELLLELDEDELDELELELLDEPVPPEPVQLGAIKLPS